MAYLAFAEGVSGGLTLAPQPMKSYAPVAQHETPAPLSSLEWSIIGLARHDRRSSLRAPGPIGRFVHSIFGGWRTTPLADPRLEALRRIAVLSWRSGYTVAPREVRAFLTAGYSPDQYEQVVDRISAMRANEGVPASARARSIH